jgi:hypothetical protein
MDPQICHPWYSRITRAERLGNVQGRSGYP